MEQLLKLEGDHIHRYLSGTEVGVALVSTGSFWMLAYV